MVNVGQVYCDIGDYAKALEYFLSALALSEELDDDRGVTTCLSNLGNVYRDIGDYAKALEYLRLAHSLSERLGIRQAIAADTGNIGSVYHDLGQYSQALEYMQLARTAYEQLGDKKGVAGVTGNIGIVYRDMGNYDDAMEYHQMSLRLAVEIGDRTMIALVTGNIGHLIAIEVFDGYNPSYAQKLLQRAIDLTIEIGNKSLLLDPYRWLAGLYQQQGKWEQAYQYLSYYHEVKEDVQGHKVHKQAQQIEHLKQIAAMEKQRVIEQSKAKAIQEVQRMKAEQVEKELGNTTLQLLAQTELLRELRSDLQKIARKIPPSEPVARELRDRIKNLPCDAVDWKKFDAQFAIAHPEFVRNLTARAPDLTVTEVRVCTMVRMNLKSHEIASLFCITDAGVEFHRRNIRRKLQLKKVEKLPLVLGAM
jgi:tetratricopeptide (TPR) repeat protein/DNA-binding CsgD family transcriptional regulator